MTVDDLMMCNCSTCRRELLAEKNQYRQHRMPASVWLAYIRLNRKVGAVAKRVWIPLRGSKVWCRECLKNAQRNAL